MNDPHVTKLRYRAIPAPFIDLIEGSFEEVRTGDFLARLSDGELVLTPTSHFASEADARRVADPFVEGWSILSGLRRGRVEIRFDFLASEMIDRDPPNDGAIHGWGSSTLAGLETHATAVVHPIRTGYPSGDGAFVATPEVQALWTRHQAYIEGREPLTSVAYFSLTYVEALAGGGSARAAKKYGISKKVLERISKLAARGDLLTARKVVPGSSAEPLTQEELKWLETALRIIIRRVGAPPGERDEVVTVDGVLNSPLTALRF